MRPRFYLRLSLLLLCYGLMGALIAQDTVADPKGSFSLTTNPPYFLFGGYYVKPAYHFPKRWSVGLTAQGGFEIPDFSRNQFFDFTGEDIAVNWNYAIGAELKYRFTDAVYDKGFYTAFNLGYEGWDVSVTDTDTFDNWFASIDLGYTWYPFRRQRFHVGLNYTLIFILNNTEKRTVNETTYNINRVVPPSLLPGAILVGWRF